LTTIGHNVFIGCALTTVSIPASVTSIGIAAFGFCDKLTSISVNTANTAFSSADGVLYNQTKTILHTCPAGKSGAFTIPASVTTIGRAAFWGCRKLTAVTIPNTVTTIRPQAFGHCGFLSIKIPVSVATIESLAFVGCTDLREVSVEWARPLNVPNDLFNETNISSATLRIPTGTRIFYQLNSVWGKFRTFVEYNPTSNEVIETPTLKASSSNGVVHISGLQPGQSLNIYNLSGQLVYSGFANATEYQIPLTLRGVYVVVAGEQNVKIMMY
jgi:hypothetical protein